MVVARSPAGKNRVVVAYDDFTSEGFTAEIIVKPDLSGFTFREGSSRVGWSRSDDDGATWVRGGKFRPQAPSFVHVATNADMAVDPGARNVVYMVAMGVSRMAWDAVASSVDPSGPPVQTGADRTVASDGVCVGRSDDGGDTFPSVKCFPLPETQPDRLRGWTLWSDAPVITVDGATTSVLSTTRLHRSRGASP